MTVTITPWISQSRKETICLKNEEHNESDFSDKDSEEQKNNKSNRKSKEKQDETIFSEENKLLAVRKIK